MFLRVASGNESDSAVFAQIFREFKKQLELDALMVADSALYTAPNIEQMATLRWLCRVPLTLKQARQLIEQLSSKDFVESTIPGYRWAAHTSNYGGVRQRWLVVESETRRVSDLRQLEKNIAKAHQEANLKDPLFFTDSVFLKSPERIEALALVMGLCLLVYTLGQRYLRSRLQQSNSTLKNQLGQPTINPTLRFFTSYFKNSRKISSRSNHFSIFNNPIYSASK